MNYIKTITKTRLLSLMLLPILGFLISSCASVPKETAQINQKVTERIQAQQKAHKALVNEYIQLKKRQVDSFIHNTYLPTALKKFRQKLKANGREPNLTPAMIDRIMKDVMAKRDRMQSQLEELRVQMITQIDEYYQQTLMANQKVSDLTASAADVQNQRQAFIDSLDQQTSGFMNINEISGKVDEYLKKAGNKAGEAEDLLEYLNRQTE